MINLPDDIIRTIIRFLSPRAVDHYDDIGVSADVISFIQSCKRFKNMDYGNILIHTIIKNPNAVFDNELGFIRKITSVRIREEPRNGLPKNLIALSIKGYSDVNSNMILSILHEYAYLRHLFITQAKNVDMNIVYDLKNLETLAIPNDHREPLIGLSKLQKLESLDLSYFSGNADEITQLTNLKKLYLDGSFDNFKKIFPQLVNLQYLFTGPNFRAPINGIRNFKNLRYLRVGESFMYPSSEIFELTQLEVLIFDNRFGLLESIDLSKFTQLQFLAFYDDGFDKPIGDISNCKQLRVLRFGRSFNKTFGDISRLENLEELVLGENFNKPLPGLSKLRRLRYLQFDGPCDQYLDDISALENLRTLSIKHMEMTMPEDIWRIKEIRSTY